MGSSVSLCKAFSTAAQRYFDCFEKFVELSQKRNSKCQSVPNGVETRGVKTKLFSQKRTERGHNFFLNKRKIKGNFPKKKGVKVGNA